MVIIQMGMNLSLGSSKAPSIVGIERCSAPYWLLQGIFFWICLLYVSLAIKMAQSEQSLKMRFKNINLVDSDIRFHGSSLT